jgi:hypothetical protein
MRDYIETVVLTAGPLRRTRPTGSWLTTQEVYAPTFWHAAPADAWSHHARLVAANVLDHQ